LSKKELRNTSASKQENLPDHIVVLVLRLLLGIFIYFLLKRDEINSDLEFNGCQGISSSWSKAADSVKLDTHVVQG
jgi:hypothetical protein